MTDPLSWVERADEDYALARSALRRKKPLAYGVCFHSQQCAEKYLKAMLVSKRQRFSKVHDLLLHKCSMYEGRHTVGNRGVFLYPLARLVSVASQGAYHEHKESL